MNTVRLFPVAIASLGQDEGVAAQLGEKAEEVRARVRAPRKMQLTTRYGVGPRGAFSQVMMRGPGTSALAIEFGTRRTPPLAPLRKALAGGG